MVKIKKQKNQEDSSLFESNDALAGKLSSYEEVFEKNKNTFSILFISIILILALFGVGNYNISSQNKLAQEDMFQAVYYFESDSLVKALNGDGNNYGFLEIIDEYNFTKAANVSNYYAGVSYLKLKDYNNAINYLKSFSSNDELIQARSYSLIGDAYTELEDYDNAVSFFKKAVNYKPNQFFTPNYLLKLALVYEEIGNLNEAYSCYTKIIDLYKDSSEYQISLKNKSRLEGLI